MPVLQRCWQRDRCVATPGSQSRHPALCRRHAGRARPTGSGGRAAASALGSPPGRPRRGAGRLAPGAAGA
eukprot:15011410-Alexandrium_andersonii.AAC.1